MRALVVLPLLLCAVVCVDQVRAQVTAMKLCGKQLINAISYTCGASRWRRFFSEPDVDGEKTLLLLISHNSRDALLVAEFLSIVSFVTSLVVQTSRKNDAEKVSNKLCIYPLIYII